MSASLMPAKPVPQSRARHSHLPMCRLNKIFIYTSRLAAISTCTLIGQRLLPDRLNDDGTP